MNRNSIRRATTCCLTAAVVLTNSSLVTHAAVDAGAGSLIAAAQEIDAKQEDIGSATTAAGISQIIASSLVEDAGQEQEAEKPAETIDTSIQNIHNEVPVETEFDDIAIAQVDNYVNVRSTPSEEGEVLGKLYNNSACTVVGVDGEWYQIHSGNVEGYIKSNFLVVGDADLAKSVGRRVADVTTDTLNVRTDASTEAELLGQVPEGETLNVIEENNGWVKVAIEEGDGWVSGDFVECSMRYQVAESKEEEEARLKKEEEERLAAEAAAAKAAAAAQAAQSSGSSGGSAPAAAPSRSYNPPSGGNGQAVADYACQFVGNPYVWGGTSLTNGADCSGFVMSVYAAFGVGLPHSSSALQGVGYGVSADAMQPGDIVCYSGHVGIYVGGNTIVHASTEATGIKYTSPANYRQIVAVRRIF